jgi:hypothetical protein
MRDRTMSKMMSVCGVMCSDCPAYLGEKRGREHQERTADAWRKIYGLDESVENISCGGCLGRDDRLFHTSRSCQARLCCRGKGYSSCAKCAAKEGCSFLEKAQSVWDSVPELAATLSPEDFAAYAQAYCDHRKRLDEVRAQRRAASESRRGRAHGRKNVRSRT